MVCPAATTTTINYTIVYNKKLFHKYERKINVFDQLSAPLS